MGFITMMSLVTLLRSDSAEWKVETVNTVPPLKMFVKMRRGEGRCSLRESSCRGGFFCIFGCLFIGKRNRKAVHINDRKEAQ